MYGGRRTSASEYTPASLVGGRPTACGRELKLSAAAIAIIGVVGLGALQADGRLIERTKSVTVPVDTGPGGTASAKAHCPKGKRVVLGGFEVPLNATDVYSTHLKLAGERGWRAGAVIAYCSKHAPRATTAKETVTVEASGKATLKANCSRDERLAFGGYNADVTNSDAFVSLHGMERTSARAWKVSAVNGDSQAAGDLTAFAYCAKR
jgi:hypothetical protein